MRMRFKPYARPELLACDFHVHEPLSKQKRISNEEFIAEQMGWKYYLPEAARKL